MMSDDIGKRLDELLDFGLTTGGAGTRASLTEAVLIARQQQAEIARLREGLTGILRKAGFTTTADDIRALLDNK